MCDNGGTRLRLALTMPPGASRLGIAVEGSCSNDCLPATGTTLAGLACPDGGTSLFGNLGWKPWLKTAERLGRDSAGRVVVYMEYLFNWELTVPGAADRLVVAASAQDTRTQVPYGVNVSAELVQSGRCRLPEELTACGEGYQPGAAFTQVIAGTPSRTKMTQGGTFARY